MCGIAGVIRHADYCEQPVNQDDQTLKTLISCLHNRGPDGSKILRFDNSVAFGSTRLAIIDRNNSNATCPLYSKRFNTTLVFNGELYNYKKLRSSLEQDWDFSTNSDSEVALAILSIYGYEKLQQQDGMFSYVFYDIDRRTCLMGSDLAGQKPLFYFLNKSHLVFSSSIESLLKALPFKKSLNYNSLTESLLLRFAFGQSTHINEILRVSPGLVIKWDVRSLASCQYEQALDVTDTDLSFEYYVQALREQAVNAVNITKPENENYAILLSGGLDSSSVATLLPKGEPVSAYSIGFKPMKGQEIYPAAFDEFEFSSLISCQCKIKQHKIYLDENSYFDNFLLWNQCSDEPMGTADSVALYALFSNIKDERIVLSGSGIDELFDGYGQGLAAQAENGSALDLARFYCKNFSWLYEVSEKKLFLERDPISSLSAKIEELLNKYRHYTTDTRKLLQIINFFGRGSTYEFRQSDQVSMHFSLEARAPYAINSFVSMAFRCKPNWYHIGREDKAVFKAALLGLVPEEVTQRKKAGFPIPSQLWYSKTYENLIQERLFGDSGNPIWEFCNRSYLKECWDLGLPEKRNIFYRLLNASLVLKRHSDLISKSANKIT